MHVTLKASLVLVGLVALLSMMLYVTGLHKNFMAGQAVFLIGAVAINVAVIIWALGKTAAENPYGRQLLNATVIGVVGGGLIVLVSWLLASVVFPNALEETRQGAIEYMEANNFPEDKFQSQLETLNKTTPMSQAIPGGLGTFATSLVTGAVFAIFRRKKSS